MIENIYEWLQYQITQNDVFAGLVGGSGVASLIFVCRSIPNRLWEAFLYHFTVQIQIHNDSEAFTWVGEWLSRLPYTQKARRVRLSSHFGETPTPDGNNEHWMVTLGPGFHVFKHKGRWITLTHEISDQQAGQSRQLREHYEIRILGRDQAPLVDIVEEAKNITLDKDVLPIYVWDGYWRVVSHKSLRPLDSVVMPEPEKKRIVGDAEWFLSAAAWYADRGVPYRRGYLFSGLPGTGKTSFVMALASHLKKPICVLNLAAIDGDDQLQSAFWGARSDAILLIEDIDAAQADRKVNGNNTTIIPGDASSEHKHVSLSGLLNVIDGVAAPDGRILIMTTNHPDRLDAALVRPGRVDLRLELGAMDDMQASAMFKRFFPECMGEPTFREGMTPAELQSLFLKHADDPKQLLEKANEKT